METNGHDISPELVEKPRKSRKSTDPLGHMMRDLRHQQREETAARIAAEREREQKEADYHLSDSEAYFLDDIRDARVSGHTSCKLLELPPDVLNIIVEHCVPVPGTTCTANLTHLRLIHPCFAYLRLLLNRLFAAVVLRVDPDQVSQLDKGAHRIAPFVRRVTFRPLEIHRSKVPVRRRKDSIPEIKKALAPRIDRVVQSGNLLSAWSAILKQCPRATEFRIECGPLQYDTIYVEPKTKTLLALAIKAIIAVDRRPTSLYINYALKDERIWEKLPAWDELDLADLKDLELHLPLQDVARKWDPEKPFQEELSLLLMNMLAKSSSSLRRLAMSRTAIYALLELDLPQLPALQEIHLSARGYPLEADGLAQLIAQLPSLNTLRIHHLSFQGCFQVEYWRPVFTVIRNHSRDLYVDLKCLSITSAARTTPSYSWQLQLPQAPRPFSKGRIPVEVEIDHMIVNYVSRHNDWYVKPSWHPDAYQDDDDDTQSEDGSVMDSSTDAEDEEQPYTEDDVH